MFPYRWTARPSGAGTRGARCRSNPPYDHFATASIGPDDAMILRHNPNPGRIEFSEGKTSPICSSLSFRQGQHAPCFDRRLEIPNEHDLHMPWLCGEFTQRDQNLTLAKNLKLRPGSRTSSFLNETEIADVVIEQVVAEDAEGDLAQADGAAGSSFLR